MVDRSPPQYSTTTECPPVLLNLAPLPDAGSSFQRGLLGSGTPSTVEGDVQIKFVREGSSLSERPAFSKLEICFRGVERSERVEIELTEQRRTLWGLGVPGSSSGDGDSTDEIQREGEGAQSRADFPPSSTRFSFDLTPDLPHCIHLGPSSLEYTLTATLHYTDSSQLPLVKSSPVHLVRSSPSGSLLSGSILAATTDPPPSTAPQTLEVASPIKLSVRLQRTVFRRSEPIELLARIEVPSDKAVREDGLRLRTVSAELVRKVTVVSATGAEDETVDSAMAGEGQEGRAETFHDALLTPPPTPIPPHITVLARSGKSARFSPTRPIIIRLILHPPAVSSCESISQATILHNITFSIRLTVGLLQGGSSRHDVTLSRTVFIVPDSPSSRTDKQREVESDAETSPGWMPADGPVPTYHESAEGSGSWGGTDASGSESMNAIYFWEDSSEETDPEQEYDGYEELSASLSTRIPPPTIDEDVSPPSASALENSSSSFHLLAGIPLDDLDHDPPPPHELSSPPSTSASLTSSPSIHPLVSLHEDPTMLASTPPEESLLPPPYVGDNLPSPPLARATGPPPYTTHQQVHHLIGVTTDGEVVLQLH